VPRDDGDRGDDAGPHRIAAEARGQPDRGETFERVGDKNENAQRLAQRAENIGRADVAAAVLADVDAARARREKSGGDRTEE
jgi:hypothetical protein